MTEEDTDIVFKNSPLFHYMNTHNVLNPTEDSADCSVSGVPDEDGDHCCTASCAAEQSSFFPCCIKTIMRQLSLFLPLEIRHSKDEFRLNTALPRAMTVLLSSEQLCECDDLRLREIQSTLSKHDLNRTVSLGSGKLFDANSVLRSCLRIGAVDGIFVAVLVASFSWILFFFFLCLVLAQLLPVLTFLLEKRSFDQLYRSLQAFTSISDTLRGKVRSAVRVIRERDVLARGYLVVSKHTPVSEMRSRANIGAITECRHLRRELVGSAQTLTTTVKAESQQLVGFSKEILSQSLASMSFGDISPVFSENFVQEECPSIELIKLLWQLFDMLKSEYLRFCCEALLADKMISRIPKSLSLITELFECTAERIDRLTAVYDYSKDATVENEKLESVEQGNFAILAAHSLCLHLQQALRHASELEKVVSKADDLLDSRTELCGIISESVRAAQNCLQELFVGVSEVEAVELPRKWARNPEPSAAVIIPEDFEPKIVDQVFEARVGRTEESGESPEGTCDDDSQKEKQRVVSRRVLDELKSVLSVRSETVRIRELKALANFRGITIEQLLEEEEAEEKKQSDETEAENPTTDSVTQPEGSQRTPGLFLHGRLDFAAEIALRARAFATNNPETEMCYGEEGDSDNEDV